MQYKYNFIITKYDFVFFFLSQIQYELPLYIGSLTAVWSYDG